MLTINKFNSCSSPKVIDSITIEELFDKIKLGDDNLKVICELRDLNPSSSIFEYVKANKIPTYRFNFLFNLKASNASIINPTGLIYIDVDDNTDIDLSNELIYSSWISVSGTGRGVLVKVDNLTLNNFSSVYNDISIELGLSSDVGARKATQQTILSYDPNIYINNNCIKFKINEKVQLGVNTEKKKTNVTNLHLFDNNEKIRFNNINDYFTDNNNEYIIFKDKEAMVIPFIPNNVKVGSRNKTILTFLTQIKLLNKSIGYNYLLAIANSVNNRFEVKYNEVKLKSIVNYVLNKFEKNELEVIKNKERRVLFNPQSKLTKVEKVKIVNKAIGEVRVNTTLNKINDCILDWDWVTYPKITQKLIAGLTNISIRTIKTHWVHFEEYVKELNKDNK